MSNSVKEQISADFGKVKEMGGVRVERIRQIFQDALAQAVTELKQGTQDISSVAKESTSMLVETLKDTQKSTQQDEVVTPVEVEIQGDDEPDNGAVADAVPVVEVPVVEVPVVETLAEMPVETVIQEGEQAQVEVTKQDAEQPKVDGCSDTNSHRNGDANGSTADFTNSLKTLIEQVLHSLKEGEAKATLQPYLEKLKVLLGMADTKVSQHYGERYDAFKQEFHQDMGKAKAWYDDLKADADAQGMGFVEYKQAELVIKMGEIGMAIAQKETKIKQLVQELWQTVTKF